MTQTVQTKVDVLIARQALEDSISQSELEDVIKDILQSDTPTAEKIKTATILTYRCKNRSLLDCIQYNYDIRSLITVELSKFTTLAELCFIAEEFWPGSDLNHILLPDVYMHNNSKVQDILIKEAAQNGITADWKAVAESYAKTGPETDVFALLKHLSAESLLALVRNTRVPLYVFAQRQYLQTAHGIKLIIIRDNITKDNSLPRYEDGKLFIVEQDKPRRTDKIAVYTDWHIEIGRCGKRLLYVQTTAYYKNEGGSAKVYATFDFNKKKFVKYDKLIM